MSDDEMTIRLHRMNKFLVMLRKRVTALASLAMPFAEMRAPPKFDATVVTITFFMRNMRNMSSRIGLAFLLLLCGLSFSCAQTTNPICYVCSDGGVSTITKPDVIIPLPENAGQSEATCEMIRLSAEIFLLIPADQCSLLDREDFRILCGCENALNQTITTAPMAVPIAVPAPVAAPTAIPISITTASPSSLPTGAPTKSPTLLPTEKPIATSIPVTDRPTTSPTLLPVKLPTSVPTKAATRLPTSSPLTSAPITSAPILFDTKVPTSIPTQSPIVTIIPSASPSDVPSDKPSDTPSNAPSDTPSDAPSEIPSTLPTDRPVKSPTFEAVEEEGTDEPPIATINPRLKKTLERLSDFFNSP